MSIQNAILNELKAMRRDLHWLLQQQTGGGYRERIFDENGCSCAHYRDTGSEQWECPLHGTVKKTGEWVEPKVNDV